MVYNSSREVCGLSWRGVNDTSGVVYVSKEINSPSELLYDTSAGLYDTSEMSMFICLSGGILDRLGGFLSHQEV